MAFTVAQQDIAAGRAGGFVAALFHLEHPTTPLRVASVDGEWTDAAGTTWIGRGTLREWGFASATGALDAASLRVVLSAAAPGYVALALDPFTRGVPATMWLAFIGDLGQQVGPLQPLFRGLCEIPSLRGGPKEPTIELTIESVALRLNRARPFRLSPEEQRARYPGEPADTGFDFVARLVDESFRL